MKNKALAVGKSLLWCFVILLFPVASGTLSVILSLDSVGTLFLQGAFMLAALVPPAVFVLGAGGKLDLADLILRAAKGRCILSPSS